MLHIVSDIANLIGVFGHAKDHLDGGLDAKYQQAADVVRVDDYPRIPKLSGTLAGSLATHVSRSGKTVDAVIGVTALYGPFIHDGTRRMVARPFLREGVDADAARVASIIGEGVEEAFS